MNKKSENTRKPRLCKECQEFDDIMNGGEVSFDVYVVCEHPKLRSNRDSEMIDKIEKDTLNE